MTMTSVPGYGVWTENPLHVPRAWASSPRLILQQWSGPYSFVDLGSTPQAWDLTDPAQTHTGVCLLAKSSRERGWSCRRRQPSIFLHQDRNASHIWMCEETRKEVFATGRKSPASTQVHAKALSGKWASFVFLRHAVTDAVTFLFGPARNESPQLSGSSLYLKKKNLILPFKLISPSQISPPVWAIHLLPNRLSKLSGLK